MIGFYRFFVTVFKQYVCKRNVIFFLLMLVLSIAAQLDGIGEYDSVIRESKEFHEAEALRMANILNYTEYSKDGIKVFVIPAASGIFFPNHPAFYELSGRVNSVASLEIHNNCKGKSIFRGESYLSLRFSVIVLLMGGFAVLFLGAESVTGKEYLKFLSSQWSRGMVRFSAVLSNFILLALTFAVLLAVMVGLTALHHIRLTAADFNALLHYFFITLLILLFLIILGAVLGCARGDRGVLGPVLAAWVVLVFIIPIGVNWICDKVTGELNSTYRLYAKKLKEVNDFEKKMAKEKGVFKDNDIEISREIIEDYRKNVYGELKELELSYKRKLEKAIRVYRYTSLFSPVTYYNLTCREVSGRGYENYMAFYNRLFDMQRDFFRFWIQRVYYNDREKIVPFIEGDENLFSLEGCIPGNSGMGAGIISVYTFILAVIFCFCFNRSFFSMSKQVTGDETVELSGMDVDLKKASRWIWLVQGHAPRDMFYNLFSGKPGPPVKQGFKGKVRLDGIDMVSSSRPVDFLYLCRREELPGGLKVKDFLLLEASLNKVLPGDKITMMNRPGLKAIAHKSLDQLKEREMFEVWTAILEMRKRKVYLIDNIAANMPVDCAGRFIDRMEELKDSGALVIYLTGTEMESGVDDREKQCFADGEGWLYRVQAKRRLGKDKNKKGVQNGKRK